MTNERSPAPVGCNEGLGLTPERTAFEAAMAQQGYHRPPALYNDGSYRDTCYSAGWDAWQAAVVVTRKRMLDALTRHDWQGANIWRYYYPSATGDWVDVRELRKLLEA